MSEIDKLYENAGIRKINTHQSEIDNGDPRFTGISHSDSYIKYPPFTAKKQIELIKWLAIKGDFDYTVDIAKNTDAYWTIYFDDSRWTAEGFEESLAGLINNIWQSLTEEEKQQIKEILNVN